MAPFLKIISVGIDMMPYLAAVAGFSSTLTFTTLSLPCSSPATSSTMGEITRQGTHHSAQKSTSTGSADFSTSASKDESLALATAMRTSAGVENRGWGSDGTQNLGMAGRAVKSSYVVVRFSAA